MVYRDSKKIDPEESMEDEEDSGEETTLIPKSLLPKGVKVGDEVKLKIVHGFDGEYEVSYSSSYKAKDDNVSEEPKSEEMEAAESELDEMAAAPEA